MKNEPYTKNPDGKLILRTLAMPSDTNANGDIFGGWTLQREGEYSLCRVLLV